MNFIMNLYLYTLAAKTLKRTATRVRIIGGSAVSAVLSVLFLLIPGMPVFIKRFAGPVLVSMVSTAAVFRLKDIRSVCRITGYLYVYAFVFGGVMKFLFSAVPFLRSRQESMWYILGAGIIAYQAVSWWIAQAGKKKTNLCRVRLCTDGGEVELCALVDTGNSLREPISGRPVSVVEAEVLDSLPGVRIPEKLKAIPYHSVGRSNGIMEGYEIPEMIVLKEEEKIRWQKVIVGISRNRISADGRYQMILHPELCSETSL